MYITNIMENIKIYDKHVAFWGSFLSNFYPCTFILNKPFDVIYEINNIDESERKDFVWKSSEQCFMAHKAHCFMDFKTLADSMSTEDPKEAKKLGRKVKDYDDEIWSSLRKAIMKKVVFEKFSQNEELKSLLLSEEFRGKTFVEGSPFDKVWGVGMDWRNPDIDNDENWKGEKLLGKVLTEIRDKFLEENEQKIN